MGSLTDLASAHLLFDRYPEYRVGIQWIESFVMQADPRLNRPGHVCPRLLPAVRQNLVQLLTIRTAGDGPDTAWIKVLQLIKLFGELFDEPRRRRAASLIAFFPDLPPADAREFIDGGHRALRMDFVRKGLMLGEFHATSTVGSVRNPDFPVMRCPVPMFAVRALSVHDVLFLDHPDRKPAERAQCLKYYLTHLDDQLTPEERRGIHQRIARNEPDA